MIELEVNVCGITKKYDDLRVMEDFKMKFSYNKIHCFLGPSGCGKTTLMHILGRLLKSDEGRVEGLDGKTFSFVFQEDRLMPWATVEENIFFVLNHLAEEERMNRIHTYLSLVDLLEFKNKYPVELSGGMKQRASIARALSFKGDILMMDEPFKGIHRELKSKIMAHIINHWKDQDHTAFFISHDLDEALALGDEIYIFQGTPLSLQKQLTITMPQKDRDVKSSKIENIKKNILEAI